KTKGKDAAFALFAFHTYLAAQRIGQLTADGKTETCSTIFSFGRSVRLPEGIEDHLPFAFRYPDPRIPDRKAHRRRLPRPRKRCLAGFRQQPDIQGDISVHLRKFKSVGKQIFEYLLQPLSVRGQAVLRRLLSHIDLKMNA